MRKSLSSVYFSMNMATSQGIVNVLVSKGLESPTDQGGQWKTQRMGGNKGKFLGDKAQTI